MKILLTGATGFIGGAFLRQALSHGHQVAVLVRPERTTPANLPASENLLLVRGTLAEAPWKQIAAFQPEVCVHTAWITTPGVYLESPENERWRDESLKFFQQAREIDVRHWVSLGTCIEYQQSRQPMSEERTPIAPATTYARCKNELRLALAAEAARHGVTFCWSRVFYPYGPGEDPARLCSSIIQKLRRGERLELKTPDSTKDYIFIDDLAAALVTVMEKRFHGAINLGTGVGVSVREVAETLGDLLGQSGLISSANPPAADPLGDIVADAGKLHSLGWHRTVTLREGLGWLVR